MRFQTRGTGWGMYGCAVATAWGLAGPVAQSETRLAAPPAPTPVAKPAEPVVQVPGNPAAAKPPAPPAPPVEPPTPPAETIPRSTNQLDVGVRTPSTITIHWLDRSRVEDGYRIERRRGQQAWRTVGQTGPLTDHVGAFTDGQQASVLNALRPDTRYCYRVIPFNALGEPAHVPEVCTSTLADLLDGPAHDELIESPDGISGLGGRNGPDDLADFDIAVVVDDRRTLLTEINADWDGRKLIYIDDDAVIDLTDDHRTRLNANLTLMSGRGGLDQGALLRTRNKTKDALFEIRGSNVEVKGLRFEGPSGSTNSNQPRTTGIKIVIEEASLDPDQVLNIAIENNEFFHWPGAGVDVRIQSRGLIDRDSTERVRIRRNFFHHNQRQSNGYGVVVSDHGYALIEKNTFDYNRHAIASNGGRGYIVPGYGPEHGYRAYLNLVLPGHKKQRRGLVFTWQTHIFDVHGTRNSGFYKALDKVPWSDPRMYNDGWAGEYMDVARNSFLSAKGALFSVRGTPSDRARFHDNVYSFDRAAEKAAGVREPWPVVKDNSERSNIDVENNRKLPDARAMIGVGDFDADGVDDAFLATGAAWYYSSGARTEWRYLNTSGVRMESLVLADADGDRITDVLREKGGTWLVSKGGASGWTEVPDPQIDFGAIAPNRGTTVTGDFRGDGTRQTLRFKWRDDRYFYVDGKKHSRHKM